MENCKTKEQAKEYLITQFHRSEEKQTQQNMIGQIKYYFFTKVKEEQAEAPKLEYYSLEECVIKKFEQRIQLKFANWLNKNNHLVDEPVFITVNLRYTIKKELLAEREKIFKLIEDHDFEAEVPKELVDSQP